MEGAATHWVLQAYKIYAFFPIGRFYPSLQIKGKNSFVLVFTSFAFQVYSAIPAVSPVRVCWLRSMSRSMRSRSRSNDSADATNPGNNLYVTGLSTRITTSDLEKFFGKEGKVLECHLVTDPRTRESRGFAFVTMETNEDAERCIKYLNRAVLEGRLVTVEKAKRKRGRTPTPGRYHGLRDSGGHDRRHSRSYSPRRWHDRDPYSRGRRGRSRSPYGRRVDDYSDSYSRRRERSLSEPR